MEHNSAVIYSDTEANNILLKLETIMGKDFNFALD